MTLIDALKKMTVAQFFQIGGAFIVLVTAILSQFLDAKLVSSIGAAVATFWLGVGTSLTKPSDQIASVAAQIDTPAVKTAILPAVARLPGVTSIQTNEAADVTVAALAASNAPGLDKILPPPKQG